MVDAPRVVRQALAKMSEDQRQTRMPIEQAAAHQTQGMDGRLRRERPDRPQQPRMTLVDRLARWQWLTRVQVERHVEFFDALPERGIRRVVVIHDFVIATDLRESVDERALEPELFHCASEFLGCGVGVLQWECRESA